MNYTKTIRTFCQQNPGMILDSAELHSKYFELVPYKTFLKVLNRLRDEGILSPVSKGVWKIAGDNQSNAEDVDDIIANYASKYNGMVVGYAMYNELGITYHKEEQIEIYTNRIQTKHKTIRNYRLTKTEHLTFFKGEKDLITILELLENRSSIIDCDLKKFSTAIMDRVLSYSDVILRDIVKSIHYQYATIVSLERMLNNLGRTDVNCVETYKKYSTNA